MLKEARKQPRPEALAVPGLHELASKSLSWRECSTIWSAPAGAWSARLMGWQERLAYLRDIGRWAQSLHLGLSMYQAALQGALQALIG